MTTTARYGMVIDLGLCIGCNDCTMACCDQYINNDYLPYSAASYDVSTRGEVGELWMDVKVQETGTFPNVSVSFVPEPCMQCDNPPCQKAATGSAIYTRPDGIVLIDPTLSVGQNQLVSSTACPYGKIYWNPVGNIPQKCTFCAHRVDQNLTPSCVLACPTSAITFGDLNDSTSAVAKAVAAGAQPLHPEYGTKPKVYYLNLPTNSNLLP